MEKTCSQCQGLFEVYENDGRDDLCYSCQYGETNASLPDYYYEGKWMVFTAHYHLKRGRCCKNGCRHCPYEPKGVKGNTTLTKK